MIQWCSSLAQVPKHNDDVIWLQSREVENYYRQVLEHMLYVCMSVWLAIWVKVYVCVSYKFKNMIIVAISRDSNSPMRFYNFLLTARFVI